MSGLRIVAGVASLGVLLLVAACTPSGPVPSPGRTSSATPASTADPVAWPDCSAFAAVIDRAGLLPDVVTGRLRTPARDSAWFSYPSANSILDSGGMACETSEGGARVSILALADALQEFDEARSAVEAAPLVAEGASRVYADSRIADGGFATCRDTGSGGLCTWSLLSRGVWFVVDAYPLDLAELVFPPDLPSGWAQQPYPVPDGGAEVLVGELAALASSSVPERSSSTAATSCRDIATPGRIESALGLDATTLAVSEVLPVEVPAQVTSTAGYALPYYAEARLGWSRCVASSSTGVGDLMVVTRPRADSSSDVPNGECRGPGDGYEEMCRVVVAVGNELRLAQFTGASGVSTLESLTALVS